MLRDQQSLSIIAPLFPRVQGNQAGVLGGCAGGVAPLRPYDMVGRDFRCFAVLSMTAPFLSPATAHDGVAIIWPRGNSGSQEAGDTPSPFTGLALPTS